MYQKVRYEKTCQYCGKKFEAHNKQKVFCSKKCKDISYRIARGIKCNTNPEPFKKICIVCGKPFNSFRESSVTCSVECSKQRQKKRHYGCKLEKHTIKCAICGKEVQSWWESQKTCLSEECKKEYSRERKRIRNEKSKEKKKIEKRFYNAIHTVERECIECGALFYCLDTESRITCSSKCSKRYANRRADKRIPSDQRVDNITLKKLYKRDNGICYLCGTKCDWNDWRESKKGNSYPGDSYPTIEHVTPISKGGLDSWDNVRLACWKCNLDKADGIIKIKPMSREYAYSEKYTGAQPKKTAQYTLDGELIKIWESTAQIKRELGLNDKHIQNVCRGNNSNTGNAYGYHWEYVS